MIDAVVRENRLMPAVESNAMQLWRYVATHTPDAVFETVGGASLASLPCPHPLFNTVLVSDIVPGAEEATIEAVTRIFRERKKPWNWTVGPTTKPANLGEILLRNGFEHLYDVPGMALDLRGYAPRELPGVAEAKDEEGLREWLGVVDRGFGLPADASQPFLDLHEQVGWIGVPVRYFYVVQDGRTVAYSMNFYGAGVAGIYCVATVPEARRQGFGNLAMHACFTAAVEDGYDVAILQSSRLGLSLYESLGFKEYCQLSNYGLPS